MKARNLRELGLSGDLMVVALDGDVVLHQVCWDEEDRRCIVEQIVVPLPIADDDLGLLLRRGWAED